MSETGYERHLERRLEQVEKDIEILERALAQLEKSTDRANLLVEQQKDIPSRVHDLEVQMVSQKMIAGIAKWFTVTFLTAAIAVVTAYFFNGGPN